MLGLMSNVSVAGLSPRRLLVDGAVLCLSFSAFVFGTAYLNPWLWFEDYPPEIQALVPNPPEVPLWQALPLALFFLGFILFLLVRSATALLREGAKPHGFLLAAVHTFVLMQIVNAWDVLIVDWLIFVTIQPAFVILPGTEGSPAYQDYWFHFWASYLNPTPWIAITILSAIVAGTAVMLRNRALNP